jgi:cell division protein FtsB
MRFVITVIALTVAAVVLVMALEPVSSDYRKLAAEEETLKRKLTRLREENDNLKEEIYRLKNSPFFLEKYARDAFGLAGTNEYIFKFDK